LGVAETAYPGLLRILDDLAFEGAVTARGQRFMLSRSSKSAHGTREGFVSVSPRGFGFVSSANHDDDVFIPRESLKGAMHGDKVIVQVVGKSSRGTEGAIETILERAIKRVAGVLRRKGRSAWIEPDDTRIRGPIVLRAESDVKGPEGNSGNDGDAAVATITRWPELPDEQAEGRLEAVLGKPGEISVEVVKILVREQIDEMHGSGAVTEAAEYGEEVPLVMLEGREDLTNIPLPTIDPEDARDHDDAVWVERTERGGYRAWIAIADVSSYVLPGTKLDAEARARGCSIYLPDRAIPMLPRALSSNLCSLLPDVIRLCLCACVELDAGGHVRNHRLIRGYMRSAAKLTYGGVARALGLTANPPRDPKAEEMIDGLRIAYELARILRARRMRRGALDFELPEPHIVFNEDGTPKTVERRARDAGIKRAYELVEELMLLANETVAADMAKRTVPTVYRVHGPPDQEKVGRFLTMCQELGIEASLDDVGDAKRLSTLLKDISEHPSAPVLNMLLLRSMKQATYDTVNIGHFGLASQAYLHFTSPIRRYPDLVVHRGVHEVLLGKRASKTREEELGESALQSSKNERKAMEIEREIVDLYRCSVMKDRVGEKFHGMVTALVGSGAYVALDDPFVDVLMRYEDMGGNWELDDDGLRATSGSGDIITLGERVELEVIDVSIVRRTTYGRKVGSEGGQRRDTRGGGKDRPRRDQRRGPQAQTQGRDQRQGGGGPDRRQGGGGGRRPKPFKKKRRR
jgi:ribonuclease R